MLLRPFLNDASSGCEQVVAANRRGAAGAPA